MKNWGGRIIILTVSFIPTQDEPDFCKSSAPTVGTGSELRPELTVLCRAEALEDLGAGLPWFEPSAGARPFQTTGVAWKLLFWKTSHQQSAALGWMSLSSQPSCAEENHPPTPCTCHLQTLIWMELFARLICSLLNLPFSPSSQYSFKAVSPQPAAHSLAQHVCNQHCSWQDMYSLQASAPNWTVFTKAYHKVTCMVLVPGAFSASFSFHL